MSDHPIDPTPLDLTRLASTPVDLAAVGELLGWAARPKETPRKNAAYRDIVTRFTDDEQFADACRKVARGLRLHLSVDPDVGVIATAYPESPLRIPMTDFMKTAATNTRKTLIGVALLGIARCAYPDPLDLDDPARVARVSVAGVVDYLNRVTEELAADAYDPEAGSDDATHAWRMWVDLKQARMDADRTTTSTRAGLVKRLCAYLVEEGLLVPVSEDDGGTYRATVRMRAPVSELARDSDLFARLITPAEDTA